MIDLTNQFKIFSGLVSMETQATFLTTVTELFYYIWTSYLLAGYVYADHSTRFALL